MRPARETQRLRGNRGFTLLELVVATLIMGVAIVGLLEGLAGATRNAARLRDYDRAIQLARQRMDEMLVDMRLPHNTPLSGAFDPSIAGGLDAGWRAQLTTAQMPPVLGLGYLAIDRLQLEVWWAAGQEHRSFTLEGFRKRALTAQDLQTQAVPQ
jgi:general secretion pathway protein I